MRNKFILLLILILGLGLRLYKVKAPLADHHSWRQADSAAVIRNLAFGGWDILHPQVNNFVPNNAKGLANPQRYFFEDFPLSFDIYPALLLRVLGNQTAVLRLSSIIFSLLTLIFLNWLVADLVTPTAGLLAAFIYAVLPFSIFFSRGVFQEIPLNFYAVSSLFFLNRYLREEKWSWFGGSVILNSLLFLTKPYALVFLLPQVLLFWQKEGIKAIRNWRTWAFFVASLIPFALWWLWVRNFPEGMPYSVWLFNEGGIRFKGSFFYWIFAQRLGMLILGFWGILFFGAGLLLLNQYSDGVFYGWLAGLLVYVFVIAKGNVTHDYYQVPFLPVSAYFMAKGIIGILGWQKKFWQKTTASFLIIIFLGFSLAFSWYQVRDFYNLTSGIDLAGEWVNRNTPPESLVIAGDGADPTLLYNTNRRGWTVGYGSIFENTKETVEKFRAEGADYYVTTTLGQIKNTPFYQYLKENYQLIKETDQFVVFDLRGKK